MSHRLGRVTVSCPELPPASRPAADGAVPTCVGICLPQGGWVWGSFLGVGSSLCRRNQSVQTNSERGERQRISPTTLSKPFRLQS